MNFCLVLFVKHRTESFKTKYVILGAACFKTCFVLFEFRTNIFDLPIRTIDGKGKRTSKLT